MKKEIASAPILTYYSPKKQTTLQTDASINGLGAYLLQDSKTVYRWVPLKLYSGYARFLLSLDFFAKFPCIIKLIIIIG